MLTAVLASYFGIAVTAFCVSVVPAYRTFRGVSWNTPLRRVGFFALGAIVSLLWPLVVVGVAAASLWDWVRWLREEVRRC